MNRLTCATVTAGVLLSVSVAHGLAQPGQVRGKVTDEWGNGIESTLVTAQSSGRTQEATTDEDGNFLGSSQRSVQLRPVYMANKSSIYSDLRGWRTPSVSGEELQTPGVRPTGDGGIARGLPVPRG